MDLHQLRCFVAVAEKLHFGRAAHELDMLPSALGRHIRLLEESLGTQLLLRTTRNVALSQDGTVLLEEAKELLSKADEIRNQFRDYRLGRPHALKLGVIDTAAAGLVPLLLRDLRKSKSRTAIQIFEDKTIRLLPKLLSGNLDLALVRPPEHLDKRIEIFELFHETPIVAVPKGHRLTSRKRLTVENLVGEPLIVPNRRSRPHSHDLTTKLFAHAGLRPSIAQVADEKQTIVNLVAAKIGLAIVPRWASRLAVPGVRYLPLKVSNLSKLNILPLAAAWVRGSRDLLRDEVIDTLKSQIHRYGSLA